MNAIWGCYQRDDIPIYLWEVSCHQTTANPRIRLKAPAGARRRGQRWVKAPIRREVARPRLAPGALPKSRSEARSNPASGPDQEEGGTNGEKASRIQSGAEWDCEARGDQQGPGGRDSGGLQPGGQQVRKAPQPKTEKGKRMRKQISPGKARAISRKGPSKSAPGIHPAGKTKPPPAPAGPPAGPGMLGPSSGSTAPGPPPELLAALGQAGGGGEGGPMPGLGGMMGGAPGPTGMPGSMGPKKRPRRGAP